MAHYDFEHTSIGLSNKISEVKAITISDDASLAGGGRLPNILSFNCALYANMYQYIWMFVLEIDSQGHVFQNTFSTLQ